MRVTPSTVDRESNIVSAMLTRAVAWKMLIKHPMEDVDPLDYDDVKVRWFKKDELATVLAIPDRNSVLSRLGCGTDVLTPTCTFTADENRGVIPQFMSDHQTLTIVPNPLGNGGSRGIGVVTSVPPGINCTLTAGVASGTCSKAFPFGAEVQLLAAPANGTIWRGWSGPCHTINEPLNLIFNCGMQGPRDAAANFDKP